MLKCYCIQYETAFYGTNWTYADGNTSLGPVPTASGDNDAPTDPDAQSFGVAMQALLNNNEQYQAFEAQQAEEAEEAVRFEDVEISLSPFALLNLWAMALLALCVNVVLIVRCMMKREKYPVQHDFASSNEAEDVDF